ncbi:hypothetical protein LCGC14_2373410, partial [marine sediment metagenome]
FGRRPTTLVPDGKDHGWACGPAHGTQLPGFETRAGRERSSVFEGRGTVETARRDHLLVSACLGGGSTSASIGSMSLVFPSFSSLEVIADDRESGPWVPAAAEASGPADEEEQRGRLRNEYRDAPYTGADVGCQQRL